MMKDDIKFTMAKVGGCVRDTILGKQSNDIDYTVVATDAGDLTISEIFDKLVDHLKSEGFEVFLVVPEMTTIRAKFPKNHINKNLVADFVLARKELGYSDDSRRPVCVAGTLLDDLTRRDFTINAIAQTEAGDLIDPFGGIQDLTTGIIRTPGSPEQSFMDDPLRVLRMFRFAGRFGFSIHSSCIEWLEMNDVTFFQAFKAKVSLERVFQEFEKVQNPIAFLKMVQQLQAICPKVLSHAFEQGLWFQPSLKKKSK